MMGANSSNMRVCIVGAKERDTEEDRQTVSDLMELISANQPGCLFITMLTHVGVGKFIREKCLERDSNDRFRFALIECNVRTYAQNLSKAELAQIYLARNGTPFEMSDVLYYLASEERRGPMEDLLERFSLAGRPVKVLMPGEPLELI